MLFTKQIGFTRYWFTSYLSEHVRHDGGYSEYGAVSGEYHKVACLGFVIFGV